MSPQRIQLRRVRGWRKPAGAIVVARPTRWGNPIALADVAGQYPSLDEAQVARLVVRDFAVLAARGSLSLPNWRFADGHRGPVTWTYPAIDDIRRELGGHDLACWCPPDHPCHVDPLIELANAPAESDPAGAR